MDTVEPEECSALLSARSSEQSSLGLIRLDSAAGLSGVLLGDDSLPSGRATLSPAKLTRPPRHPADGTSSGRDIAGLDDLEQALSPEIELNSTGYDDAYDVTLSEGDCTDDSDSESSTAGGGHFPAAVQGGGLDPRYLCRVSRDRSQLPIAGSLTDSLTVNGGGIEAADSVDRLHLSVPAADADISGQQISARSTSIGATRGPGSLPDFGDDTGNGFGSECFDGLEEFQKEFDAGGFVSGGEAFKAELVQAEQSLDRNGLPLVNFSLSSGTYDPHARVRPSDCDESVNISQFLKAGSYPMGVLGDASNVEPPPRFGMSATHCSWQTTTGPRSPGEDLESTGATLPRSRDTFSVSPGSGYSQIHGGPVRVGTYTVLTAAEPSGQTDPATAATTATTATATATAGRRAANGVSAHLDDDAAVQRTAGKDPTAVTVPTDQDRGQPPMARKASAEQRYSKGAYRTTSPERSRSIRHAKETASFDRTRFVCGDPRPIERSRPSQDSQEGSTLVNASRPSQDSQSSQDSRDVTLTPERGRVSRDAATPTTVRPRPQPRLSAAMGDSLRRKIVDVLNRTEEARLQLLSPGRRTTAEAVNASQQRTLTEMVTLSEQPLKEPAARVEASTTQTEWESSPVMTRAAVEGAVEGWRDATAVFAEGSAVFDSPQDDREWSQTSSQTRGEEMRRRQQQEMAEHKRYQEERVLTARAQQTALRQQWEMQQDLKEKVARQRKMQKKRDAKARRNSAGASEKSGDASNLEVNDVPPAPEPPPPPPSSQPAREASTVTSTAEQTLDEAPVEAPPAPTALVDPETVSRVIEELNTATPALTVQQVVEAVMRQLAVPDVSLEESCRSRTELNVTDILQELRMEGEELRDQMARSARPGTNKTETAGSSSGGAAAGSNRTGDKDVGRMAETVSRLHRGVPARPRGEQSRRRSPVQRSASIPVQQTGSRRGPDAARPASAAGVGRRLPTSTSTSRADRGRDDATRRRPNSAQAELAVRGRRVPKMGTRRHVDELTTNDSDRNTARGKRGSPGKPARKPPGRTAAAVAIATTAAKASAVSTCPDTASSDGSGRTYSIASDRAPGSLPAVVAEARSEPEQPVSAAPTAVQTAPAASTNPPFDGVPTDYESPEFLVALAARRYPSSTPSLARSVAAFVAGESLDHVSPITPGESDASETGGVASSEQNAQKDIDSGTDTRAGMSDNPGGIVKAGVMAASGTDGVTTSVVAEAESAPNVAVLVPPPAVWPSEGSSEEQIAADQRHNAETSTGSVTTTAASAVRPSSGVVSLPGAASLQTQREVQQQQQPQQPVTATGSTSAEAAAGAPRPRRSRIPTPVRRHVNELAAASVQSAPCLLQPASTRPPPPLPSLPLPSAMPGRRPGVALSSGDRQTGPRPATRANSVGGAGTCDAAAQTSLLGPAAAATGRPRDKLVRSVSEQAQTSESGAGKTSGSDQARLGRGQKAQTATKATSRVSTLAAQVSRTAAETAPPAPDKAQTERLETRKRTPSVSTGVQTSDQTFTVRTPPADVASQSSHPWLPARVGSVEKSQLGQSEVPEKMSARVSAEAQTETEQPWAGRNRYLNAEPDRAEHEDIAPDMLAQVNGMTPVTHGGNVDTVHQAERSGPTGQGVQTDQTTLQPAAGPSEDTRPVETPAHVTHPDILCTDIPTDISVPVTNVTDHWVQLVPTVASLELNGLPLPVDQAPSIVTLSFRTRTLLDRHQESVVHVNVTPRCAGRITITLALNVDSIERRLSEAGWGAGECRVELRLVAERPAVEVLSQEPGVLDFGTLPEDCRRVVPLTLVNLSRAAVPVTLSVLSAGRAFHLPDADCADPSLTQPARLSSTQPTRLSSTLAQLTLPPADATRQGIAPVTLNVALLTPCLQTEIECPPVEQLHGSLEVQLDGAVPPPAEPLLRCRLLAAVGRVKLRTRSREPLELRCRPAQTTSVNLPMRNAGNIPLELRLSVTGLRDSVWVRPDHVTVPPQGERDVMLTFQPRDRHAGGRGLLVLTVQPEGVAYEVDIVGVIGDHRTAERPRPGSPEMKSARRHTRATRKQRSPSQSQSGSRAHNRSHSRSVSPRPVETAVQTSLVGLASAGDGPAPAPAPAPALAEPVFRQPAEPPPMPKPQRPSPPVLHSNKRVLVWTGVRCGRPAAASIILRNSSETDVLMLRTTIVNGPQFRLSIRTSDEESVGTTELRLPPRSERELTVVYQPTRVEATAATLVLKPVMRPRGTVASKFTIPLIGYSGAADVQPSVSPDQGVRLGELQPASTVHVPLTVTNTGDRRAFCTVLAYRDAECRHPVSSSEFSARPARLSLAAGEARQVALVLRVRTGSPPPASLRLLSGDELLRQAFSRLPRDRPLSSRLASPGLISVDFSGPFDGEVEPDPAEQAALAGLPSVADAFFGGVKQTRIPVRATISSRPMDSSDVFTMLHADDTVASILNSTSNATREARRPPPPPVTAAVTSCSTPQRINHARPAPAHCQLNTSQRPVRLSAAPRVPPPSDISVESGPVGTDQPVLPPPLPPTGGGRPAALRLDSDQVLFPTTTAGQRSAAALDFTNTSGVRLRWTLEALVKPWIQSTPRACDLTQVVEGAVFRFHPTQGEAPAGQRVSLAARFSPPVAGYFTQTFYLVTCADSTAMDSDQPIQPSCLLVRVAGQAVPAPVDRPERPEPFPLAVEPDTIEFPADQRAVKLTINNKTRIDYEFELQVSGPFSVNHERMLSRARRYIHLPVFFQPPSVGLFTGRLTLSLVQSEVGAAPRLFHVTLLAEVP